MYFEGITPDERSAVNGRPVSRQLAPTEPEAEDSRTPKRKRVPLIH